MLNKVEKPVEEIEFIEPIEVKKTDCVPGVLCEPKDHFEMISECALCGKLV